jgi:glycosyltransferase involved in cell wall biosynthesis
VCGLANEWHCRSEHASVTLFHEHRQANSLRRHGEFILISIIIPAFNEGDGLRQLHERLSACAATWNEDYEFVLVDDGSRDHTLAVAEQIAHNDQHLKIVSLSRNFGHQPAVTAGLEHARGDLIAVIDADLQDPPEELHRFFAKCRRL